MLFKDTYTGEIKLNFGSDLKINHVFLQPITERDVRFVMVYILNKDEMTGDDDLLIKMMTKI